MSGVLFRAGLAFSLIIGILSPTLASESPLKRTDTGLPADACGVYAWPNWRPNEVNRWTGPLASRLPISFFASL